ncbi:MAG: hypothetical protein OEQ39_11455 [Gammaproteobacteria bacterium]|nr:hypothetical protein [Gammaproteobacteria bacterium]MDH3464497.1 hypothetical protein [Gammaproteobacteria bacterium]
MQRKSAVLLRIWVIAWLFWTTTAYAGPELIDPFIGEYTGQAKVEVDGVEHNRDLKVSIAHTKGGFNVTWDTTKIKASGKSKTKSYSINFVSSPRPNVFASAMKVNVFGGHVALDPMQGDPYVWARIEGPTLTVYALHILDDGGYEMQVYDRTIAEGGLELRFSRIRNGTSLRDIRASLGRIGSGG